MLIMHVIVPKNSKKLCITLLNFTRDTSNMIFKTGSYYRLFQYKCQSHYSVFSAIQYLSILFAQIYNEMGPRFKSQVQSHFARLYLSYYTIVSKFENLVNILVAYIQTLTQTLGIYINKYIYIFWKYDLLTGVQTFLF